MRFDGHFAHLEIRRAGVSAEPIPWDPELGSWLPPSVFSVPGIQIEEDACPSFLRCPDGFIPGDGGISSMVQQTDIFI